MKNSLSRLALAVAALTLPIVAVSPATSYATTAYAQAGEGRALAFGPRQHPGRRPGRTLYLFEKDKRDRSACASTCATYWPPLLTHGKPAAGKGIQGSLLGITHRAGGEAQVTYAGHPLYRFVQDTPPVRRTARTHRSSARAGTSSPRRARRSVTRPSARRRLATGAESDAAGLVPASPAAGRRPFV